MDLITSHDAFLGDQLMIQQPKSGYRAGLDAVMLASVIGVGPDPISVLDVGAGVGTVGLCVARRCQNARVVLLERESLHCTIAQANIAANKLGDRVTVLEADLASQRAIFDRADVLPDRFDFVLANPPYYCEGRGTLSPDPLKAVSHAMPEAELETWVRFMARFAKPGGTVALVHRADALGEILAAFERRFGAVRVLALHPREGDAAHRVIVTGIKGSRAPLQLLAGFVLHGADHGFSPRAQAILRDGAALGSLRL
jgi:tRNA1(Val) A37 N6-methylase TrmN6